MKYKLKENKVNFWIIGALAISLIFAYTSSFYMNKLSGNDSSFLEKTSHVDKNGKHLSIKDYVVKNKDVLVLETDISKDVTTVLTTDGKKYISKIFDYKTGKEVSVEDLIVKESLGEFYEKINELLLLKYPKFITDELVKEKVEKVYSFKNSELIIYYYNYEITPEPNEEISLKVDYNEIKEYLNINVNYNSTYENEDGSLIDLNKKQIAITFDDGPCGNTSGLVDILVNNKVKATFFMLGKNLNYYKNAVLKVHENGMEIGYHSYAHTNLKRQKAEEIKKELETSNQKLENLIGDTFHMVRPPYGSLNDTAKETLDLPIILWQLDTLDWKHKDPEYLVNYVIENVKEGDIVLFHDLHKTSVEAIEKLLPELYVRGYQVVTVSKLAELKGKTLEPKVIYKKFSN